MMDIDFQVELEQLALHKCFKPSSVAIIGATERAGSVGKTILENLINCRGEDTSRFDIFPVNVTRKTCCNLPCYSSVKNCPKTVDLAVIVIPAHHVKNAVIDCGESGVKFLIIISAGFKELGDEGLKRELEVVDLANKYSMRIIGPNCLGIMCPNNKLNATFAASDALKGSIAFISQSGAMCTCVLDWSLREKIGFSAFISIGSMCDISWPDIIEYFGHDPETKAILIYMESIGNAEKFIEVAREITKIKPIIVIKAGITSEAKSAAESHTGSLAGSHDSFICTMKRCNIIVVDSITEFIGLGNYLSKQPIPQESNLCIITNAGGPGVLATDSAVINGLKIYKMSTSIINDLSTFLPSAWSHSNPVDILGDASPEIYHKTVEAIINSSDSKNINCLLVILSPQSVTNSDATAESIVQFKSSNIPIVCAWMGGEEIHDGSIYLNSNGVPCFNTPDLACQFLGKLVQYKKNLSLYVPNTLLDEEVTEISSDSDHQTVQYDNAYIYQKICNHVYDVLPKNLLVEAFNKSEKIIQSCLSNKRFILTEFESKKIFSYFKIPMCETTTCRTVEEAILAAKQLKFPVVIKLHSEKISHKSDVGGVHINIQTEQELVEKYKLIKFNLEKLSKTDCFQGVTIQPFLDIKAGYELILGSTLDLQYGPTILFGFGGIMVEVFKDCALNLQPLDPITAFQQITSTKIYQAICAPKRSRFLNISPHKLIETIIKFSMMIGMLSKYVQEVDINPLLALQQNNRDILMGLDARIILRDEKSSSYVTSIVSNYPLQYNYTNIPTDTKPVNIYPAGFNDFQLLSKFKMSYLAYNNYSRRIPLLLVQDDKLIAISIIYKLPYKTPAATIKTILNSTEEQNTQPMLLNKLLETSIEVAKSEKVEKIILSTPQICEKAISKYNYKTMKIFNHDQSTSDVYVITF